jgi:flagellar biosynthesis protein FlhF
MLRRRHEALNSPAETPTLTDRSRDPTSDRERMPAPQVARHTPLRTAPVERPAEPAPRRRPEPQVAVPASSAGQQSLMNELHAMKELIEDRFNTLSWLGQAKQNPIQSNLMLKLIRAGYSPALSRAILERMPEELSAAESVRWLMEVLERNLKTDMHAPPLYEEGGIFALVGSTGVGKTTTTAKLAAHCARIHGPASVGLITLDTYRVGAHEQLRTYGRMLGIVAHLAHDRAALQDLLGLLSGKKMVLIDTTGVAPRDPRKRDMLDVLDLPNVNRLLVLNAGCHGDTLDDVLTAFKTSGSQQAILSKVDEAVKLGPALDALIRHQMVLRGITNGQRVPEDWETADAHKLISASMRAPTKSAFDPRAADLNFFFSHSPDTMTERGLVDA